MKRALLFAVMMIAGLSAVAQSNEFVDGLLAQETASYGQVSYLVLVASDNLSEDSDEARAFELLENLGWAPDGATVDSKTDLASYALILMRAFGLKGGVMYSLFAGPRYAYRELSSRQVIQGRSDPGMAVDGSTAVRMLGRVFDIIGANR